MQGPRARVVPDPVIRQGQGLNVKGRRLAMNLIELFEPNLGGRADQPALLAENRWLSFGELDRVSASVAAALRDRHGLGKGDRAALYLANGPAWVLFYLACLKLGVIVVPVNLLYRRKELADLIGDAEPKVLLTDAARLDLVQEMRGGFSSLTAVILAGDAADLSTVPFSQLADHVPAAFESRQVTGDDAALMLYTSGTTGRSKGAVLSHHNLASNIIALLHVWQWTRADRFVLCLPLFHAHGLCNGLHGALASGCRTHLCQRFHAAPVIELLHCWPATLFFGVPTMYERLLEAADAGHPVPQAMRLYVSGSAPLSPDAFNRFRRKFGHDILERYGMSETVMISSNLYASNRVPGTVGKPLPGVSVRLMGQDGRLIDAASQPGEIQVTGPNVFKAYWHDAAKTEASFVDGWFKTEDLGQWDVQGRLIICGRMKELIISGGFNIYPQELNNVLCAHSQISEAAVIGVPDQMRGELVKAYVVASDRELGSEAVIEHCRSHLASFKVPRSVVFLDRLPRNGMGKVQLHRLPERDRL